MSLRIVFILLCLMHIGHSQDAIHNYGSLQMHDDVSVGFHADLINDGSFDQNKGLAGFYGYNKSLMVSGAFNPIFYDAEFLTDEGLYLETAIGVLNNANLITGDIITPRDRTNIFSNFIDDAFYLGENDVSHIDGYAAITNKSNFIFPVGADGRLRPLGIASTTTNWLAKCAYFFEDPNAPSTFGESFPTSKKATDYLSISELEFWNLEGDVPTAVTLTWDEWSNVRRLAPYLSDLKVVGWHKEQQTWVNLGNADVQGGMDNGSVTSDLFVPNDYEIITLGGNDDALEDFKTLDLANYFMTPNGDGKNDVLVLEGLEKSPNNNIQIFNRYGVMVYSMANYQNSFDGTSNRQSVINRNARLESGIYFYIITLNDLRQKHQGYLYLSTDQKN